MSDTIDREQIEELRRIAKERYFTRANMWNQTANDQEAGLRNLMFTLATFLFTFSSPIFLDTKSLNQNEKLLFLLGWIFLLVSIVIGIIDFVFSIKFYNKAARRMNLGEKIFSTPLPWSFQDYQKAIEESVRMNEAADTQTNPLRIAIQVIFMFIGFIFILIGATSILY